MVAVVVPACTVIRTSSFGARARFSRAFACFDSFRVIFVVPRALAIVTPFMRATESTVHAREQLIVATTPFLSTLAIDCFGNVALNFSRGSAARGPAGAGT